jgi:molybdopterin synthase sulfur carrier subunit
MIVKLYGPLRAVAGDRAEVELALEPGATVEQALARLVARYPALRAKLYAAQGELGGDALVLVNGRAVRYLQGAATPLAPDDRLALFYRLAGG